jgi:putative hydrolase of the HAD superfamily
MSFLSRYRVILLDMNGTFMFGHDRLGPGKDFAATYAGLGGTRLDPDEVRRAVLTCCGSLARDYEDPARHDEFPSVVEALAAAAPGLPEADLRTLEEVIAQHELGRVPDAHAAFLRQLAGTHRLAVVSNLWSRKGPWLAEFERAGIARLFSSLVFSSDGRTITPSPALFRRALAELGADATEAVYVGDSLRCDVRGAKAAGPGWGRVPPAAHPASRSGVEERLVRGAAGVVVQLGPGHPRKGAAAQVDACAMRRTAVGTAARLRPRTASRQGNGGGAAPARHLGRRDKRHPVIFARSLLFLLYSSPLFFS